MILVVIDAEFFGFYMVHLKYLFMDVKYKKFYLKLLTQYFETLALKSAYSV